MTPSGSAGSSSEGLDDDRVWVERARGGERAAFDELVRRHQHRLVNMLRAMVGTTADAEDVAQETLIRAYRAIGHFRGESRFSTWLFQIAMNASRSHTARRAREADRLDRTATPVEQTSPDDERRVLARDRIDRALATLPADLREAVVLRDLEDLDYAEIARLVDVPLGTVESRIFRGRQRLRDALQAQDAERDHTRAARDIRRPSRSAGRFRHD